MENIFDEEFIDCVNLFIENKMPLLRENLDFENKDKKLSESIENLTQKLNEENKNKLEEVLKLFYETERYLFVLAYSLGIKYGKDLTKI